MEKFWRSGWLGAVATGFLGLTLLHPALSVLRALSYDTLSLLTPGARPDEAVIVYMDEESYEKLHQPIHGLWDRRLHARLIRELLKADVRCIAFDVLFDRSNSAEDGEFAAALTEGGDRIILASVLELSVAGEGYMSKAILPSRSLGTNLAHGVVNHLPEMFGVVRRQEALPHPLHTTFARKVLQLHGADGRVLPDVAWLRYYGAGAIPAVSYQAILSNTIPAHRLAGKVVFVGRGNLITAEGPLQTDFHRTPSFWLGTRPLSGVELHATAFLNLLRGEWWTAMPSGMEAILVVLFGIGIGRAFATRGFRAAFVLAGIAAITVLAGSLLLLWTTHLWFSWMVVAVQISCALVFAVMAPQRRQYDVFISYRRKDSGHALWIRSELERRRVSAYLDLAELSPGDSFSSELKSGIAQAPLFVVLLGPDSIDRCWLEDDVMTREIVHASELRKQIIPILIDGASWDTMPLDQPPVNIRGTGVLRNRLPKAITDLSQFHSIVHNPMHPQLTIGPLTNARVI